MNMFRRSWALHLSLYSLTISVTLCQSYHSPSKEYVLVPKEYLESTIHDFRSPYEAIQRPDRSAGSMYPTPADEPSPIQEYYSSPNRANNLYSQIEADFYKHAEDKNDFPPSQFWARPQAQDTRKSYEEPKNERTSSPGYYNRAPYHELYPSPNQFEDPAAVPTQAPRPRATYKYKQTPVDYEPVPEEYEELPEPEKEGNRDRFPNFKDRKRHVEGKRQRVINRQPSPQFVPTVPSVPITAVGSTITEHDLFAKAQSGQLRVPHKRPSLTLLDEDVPQYSKPHRYATYEDQDIEEYTPTENVPIRPKQRLTYPQEQRPPYHKEQRPTYPQEQPRYHDYPRPESHQAYPTDQKNEDFSDRPFAPKTQYQPVEAPNVHAYTEDYYSSQSEDEVPEQTITRRYTPPRKSSSNYPGENDFRGPPTKTKRPNKDIFITPPPTKEGSRYKSERNERPSVIDPELEAEKQKHKNIQLHNLQKLIDYADGGSKNDDPSDFKCPKDGHFGDKDDCAKFYRCAHGTALIEYCPGQLFWNSVTEQCDWPEAVDCSYTAKSLETYQLTESDPVTIYLTFDDGPNEGTPAILQALRHHNVKATFFINSRNLHDPKPELAAQNANSLLAIIADGHVIGDHSYDHMAHNSKNSPKNAYQNVEEDSKYFGIMNTYPVLDILWKADMKQYIGPVNHTMTYYVRLPYTNAWRAGNVKRDCYSCTVPGSSGQKGIEISNLLAEEKKLIFGWDQEWEIDWNRNRFKYGGKEMFFRLARDPRKKPQMVLLTHDLAYRPYALRDEQKELEEFLHLAKESGYKFATLDKYKLE